MPVGHPWNPQVHGGGQGSAGAKGHPEGTTGASICLWLCRPGIPSCTPLWVIFIPTGCRKSWTPGCSLQQRRVGTPREKVSTCKAMYVLGFSPQQEELRALCFNLPPPHEVLSLSQYQRGGWSAERLTECLTPEGSSSRRVSVWHCSPCLAMGLARGGTRLQSPREHSPSSLPRWLQGLSCVKMGDLSIPGQ